VVEAALPISRRGRMILNQINVGNKSMVIITGRTALVVAA